MYENKIVTNERKAIKEHWCSLCKSKIEIGEVYTIITKISPQSYYTKFRTFKLCLFHDIKKIKIVKNKLKEITDG